MNFEYKDNCVIIHDTKDFSLKDTLDCGQCFRWEEIDENTFVGVAKNKILKISSKNNKIILHNTSQKDFKNIWFNYFDLGTDYSKIKESFMEDEILSKAVTYSPGIRVLKQDGWEALLSFIISQNNNVKRIKGIVKSLCEKYGEEISEGFYNFPSPKVIAPLSIDELMELKCGFRAKYICDCANKIAHGQINLSDIYDMDIDKARETLIQIKGVGAKVAECALLYGFGRMECFPKDVWINRAMDNFFPNGLPEVAKNSAGIAQQFIFHYIRTCKDVVI